MTKVLYEREIILFLDIALTNEWEPQQNHPSFHPKGHAIEDYSLTQIRMVEEAMNNLPRNFFVYKKPNELFEEEL